MRATQVRGHPRRNERPRLARPASSSARALQRAALVGADHLVLETLEEELPATARAQRLIGLVPDRGLTANGRVCGPQLRQRGTTGSGRYKDLPEPMSTEIAIKLSTNGHKRPPPGNTPRTVPGLSFVPLPRNDRSRSVNPYAKPPSADLLPLNRVRPRAAKPRGAGDLRRSGYEGSAARRTRSEGKPGNPRRSGR